MRISLFLKLLIVFLVTALLIFSIIFAGFQIAGFPSIKNRFSGIAQAYAEKIILQIKPDFKIEQLQSIEKQEDFLMAVYQGEKVDYINPELSFKDLNRYLLTPLPKEGYFGHLHGGWFYVLDHNDKRFFIVLSQQKHLHHNPEFLFFILIGVLLVLAMAHFWIKRIFKPIALIQDEANKISLGNFNTNLNQIKQRDELGLLARSIEKMAAEIKAMLDSKRTLLLSISHEVRSPLTRLRLATEFVDNNEVKSSMIQDIAEMEKLLSEILEAERLAGQHCKLNLEYTDVNLLLMEFSSDHRVEVQLSPSPLLMALDKIRFKLLLKNLVDNSKRHSENDQKITLSAHKTEKYIELHVLDQGDGIDPQHLPHLMEPFYRPDPSRQKKTGGLGLGLYLVKLITEAHKGSVHIQSEKNRGTEVTLRFPLN